jgi:hypothetical protein
MSIRLASHQSWVWRIRSRSWGAVLLRRQKSSTKRRMAMKMRREVEGTTTSGNRV